MPILFSPPVPFWDVDPSLLNSFDPDPTTGGITRGGFQAPPTRWDVVLYGPTLKPLPGMAEILRCTPSIRRDGKRGPGTDGEVPTVFGNNPVTFDFSLAIWSPEQLEALANEALPVLFPGKGQPILKSAPTESVGGFSGASGYTGASTLVTTQSHVVGYRRVPVLLSHPALDIWRVRSVIVESVNGPRKWRGKNDIFEWSFHCVEFHPARQRKSDTPTGPQAQPLPTSVGASNSASSLDPATTGGAAP